MLRLAALPLALVLLGTATAARAESSYALEYRSAEGCPSREHFIAELGLRSQGLHEASNETPHVSIEVWFEGHEPTNGILLLRDSEGRPTLRTIPGATCAEVVAALALTASLLIDAQRQAAPAPAPVAPAAPAVLPPPAQTAESTPAPPPASGSQRTDTVDKGSEDPQSADKPSTLKVHVGAGVAAEQGVAPNMAVAGAFELAMAWQGRYVVRPLIGVTLERTLPETVEQTQGQARFRWTALRLGLCPLRLPREGRVLFRPCGLFEGGAIEADGVDVPDPDDATAPWWAAGVSGRLEVDLFEPLSGLVELGARVQFRQDRFYFDPDSPQTTIFEVPPAGFFGRAGIQGGF